MSTGRSQPRLPAVKGATVRLATQGGELYEVDGDRGAARSAQALDVRAKQIKSQMRALREELQQISRERDSLLEQLGIRVTHVNTQALSKEIHSGNQHPAQARPEEAPAA
jgi:predicted  nucleic acid-binding Zn-ribbon protein